MWDNGNIYEYIYMYVDNLEISLKDTNTLIYAIEKIYRFKLKGMGPIMFWPGWYLFFDKNGVLLFNPHKYTGNMYQRYVTMFGSHQEIKRLSETLCKRVVKQILTRHNC